MRCGLLCCQCCRCGQQAFFENTGALRLFWKVLQVDAKEMLLELMDLCKVCIYVVVFGLVYFVGEVDDELRVALDDDVQDS